MPRLHVPRVAPLTDAEMDEETRALLGATSGTVSRGPILNIFRTLAHHPKLMRRWLVFGAHVLAKSTLPLLAPSSARVSSSISASVSAATRGTCSRGIGISSGSVGARIGEAAHPGWETRPRDPGIVEFGARLVYSKR